MTAMMIRLNAIKLFRNSFLTSNKPTFPKKRLFRKGQLWTPIWKLQSELFKRLKEEGKE